MKLRVEDVDALKATLLSQVLEAWERLAEQVEAEHRARIEAEPETPEPYATFSRRERAEQEAAVAISAVRTPLQELRTLCETVPIPAQEDDRVRDFSLFDVTVRSAGSEKTTTYFVLPLQSLPPSAGAIRFGDASIVLTNRSTPWFGKVKNDRVKSPGGARWEEPHMGHVVQTGTTDRAETFTLIHVYRSTIGPHGDRER